MNFSLTSIPKANAQRSEFIEESGIQFLFKEWNKVLGRISQLTEAFEVPRTPPEPSGKCLEP